jgi:hypothetical protein
VHASWPCAERGRAIDHLRRRYQRILVAAEKLPDGASTGLTRPLGLPR